MFGLHSVLSVNHNYLHLYLNYIIVIEMRKWTDGNERGKVHTRSKHTQAFAMWLKMNLKNRSINVVAE